jgi:DNA-binding CsgD family transcriptional regulator
LAQAAIEDVSRVVGRFYAAAYGQMSWNDALSDFATLFHASRSWLFVSSDKGITAHSSVDDPGFHSPEAQITMRSDPLFGLSHANPVGKVIRHSEMEEMAGFYRRALFQDWLRPRDVWFGLQAHLKADATARVFVDISHGRNQGDFTDDDKALLAMIGAHITRAADISRALGSAAMRSVADLAVASLVVDGAMQVLDFNTAAAALFADADNRSCALGGLLDVSKAPLSPRVRDLVADAVLSLGARGGGVAVSDDPSDPDGRRFVLSVAPMPQADYFGLSCRNAALIQLRPARGGGGEGRIDALLMQLFGLSPSQARLARVLSGGESLRQAAAERGLSYRSARTYLDRIYRATGTSRQSELVALLKTIEAGS